MLGSYLESFKVNDRTPLITSNDATRRFEIKHQSEMFAFISKPFCYHTLKSLKQLIMMVVTHQIKETNYQKVVY